MIPAWGFPGGKVVKNPPANVEESGDTGWIPGSGRSLGGGNGNPLQNSCLKNSKERGAWQGTVPRVTNRQTWLRDGAHDSCLLKTSLGIPFEICIKKYFKSLLLFPMKSHDISSQVGKNSSHETECSNIYTLKCSFLNSTRVYLLCVLVTQSCLILCDPMMVADQALLSMEFSRQEY